MLSLYYFCSFLYVFCFIVSCCAFNVSKTKTALVYAIWGPFLKPLGSNVLQNRRLKSDSKIVCLFLLSRWLCCVVLRIRCFENPNSNNISDLGPFFDASGKQCSSNLPPKILCPNAVKHFLLSPGFYCVVLRVRCFESSNSISICDFGPLF